MFKFTLAAVAAVAVGATELTPANFAAESAGKTVFIKFQAPWWGHCKSMKPDWDKLMTEYAGSTTVLVGDVDCTAAGKPLCDSNDVKGFPTIKHGDPAAMEDYSGGRKYADLSTFAAGLKPLCSPANLALCDEEQTAAIVAIQALTDAELDEKIAAADKATKDAETTFDTELAALQATYKALQETKEKAIAAVKDSGIGLVRAVKATKAAAAPKAEL